MIIGSQAQNLIRVGDRPVEKIQKGADAFWEADDRNWSYIVVPDVQRLAANNPTALNSLFQWIVDEVQGANTNNIKMVVILGDLANNGASATEWARVDTAVTRLHGVVPFILMAGNHDYDDDAKGSAGDGRKEENWKAVFPHSDFTGYDWYLGSYNDITTNMAAQIQVGQYRYRFVGNEFQPRAGALNWAKNLILTEEKDYDRAIYATHTLTDPDGLYAGEDRPSGGGGQAGQPKYYSVCDYSEDGDCKTGQEIFTELIDPANKLIAAYSGHDVGSANVDAANGVSGQSAYSKRIDYVGPDDDRPVNVQLLNYQNMSGSSWQQAAYLRIVKMTHDGKTFSNETYNPVLDINLTDAQNQFTGSYY